MPTISYFYGIVIQMFWNDHAPPHFHALYGEHEAIVVIETQEFIRGSLPPRAQGMVLEWAKRHQDELMENWEICRQHKKPRKISPLK